MDFFDRAFENLNAVGLRQPIALGLDTSLAQVALRWLCHRRKSDLHQPALERNWPWERLAPVAMVSTKKTGISPNDTCRRRAMKSLERLNELQISKNQGNFHNNSIPTLCALLIRADKRPKTYVAGPPINANRDFDSECNGYPLGIKAPRDWNTNTDYLFDTRSNGLSNSGHDEEIFLRDGQELLSAEDKSDLIQFLQTL